MKGSCRKFKHKDFPTEYVFWCLDLYTTKCRIRRIFCPNTIWNNTLLAENSWIWQLLRKRHGSGWGMYSGWQITLPKTALKWTPLGNGSKGRPKETRKTERMLSYRGLACIKTGKKKEGGGGEWRTSVCDKSLQKSQVSWASKGSKERSRWSRCPLYLGFSTCFLLVHLNISSFVFCFFSVEEIQA